MDMNVLVPTNVRRNVVFGCDGVIDGILSRWGCLAMEQSLRRGA